ncbi:helix-turn-helix domain-containing protein [Clostridium sporogenes]|uniref:helix-turn-helix domain-containing protein n=1 Tax=Clostridium sporogenes TaxID=1509 RepID=UPI00024BA026|nr:helix-turn-helix transcriptional regulator [Clostridium sporogenes]EHN13410.1 helix-turn-helix domain-containing protein [Clostridium sporogenes PA 3679]MDU4598313.1 helix-turn-helix transcriptional regulator [Clostridium sporogenes]NFQ33541.1 helix-turn-helix transcriptional regulator [Clostridium sporogenes]NFQ61185.1 helix-turn-helix transcriptional regulator [Clostridium sporogenes]NFU09092.1 helix-turn-helix transcriptional regulator [Clostridium sporogenes]
MNDILSFGKFITDKRKALGITLRGMATEIGIAPAYLSDIEKGRRYPPDMDKLIQIAKILKLTEDEKNTMFDLAGEGKNTISPDLPEYIMSSEKVRVALRKAREVATEEDWEEFVKKLTEKGGRA